MATVDTTSLNYQQAVAEYGQQMVDEIVMLIEMSCVDGTWALFKDLGQEEHVDCIESYFM